MSTEVRAAPKVKARNAALDRARTFITLLVLIHHSVIAYTHFGHTDPQSFLGFDIVVTFNDSFFMPAMFLLSGLFVWPSLRRKEIGWFLRDRWWRLGKPLIVSALILIPFAYYAVEMRLHPGTSFAAFWWNMVTVGPWRSGPEWFVWVLLATDLLAAAVYRTAPGLVDAIGRLSLVGYKRPGLFFLVLSIATVIAYVPAVLYFDASRWFTLGPIAVQASRIFLYPLYFFVGVGIGAVRIDQGVLAADGGFVRRWPLWLVASAVSFSCMIGLIYIKHAVLPDANHQPLWWEIGYALAFAAFCAAQTLNILALFLRFDTQGSSRLDPLRDNAYGIYLLHYIPVMWLQYLLYDFSFAPVMQVSAIIKAMIVFVLTLAASWAATAMLRKIPGMTHVL